MVINTRILILKKKLQKEKPLSYSAGHSKMSSCIYSKRSFFSLFCVKTDEFDRREWEPLVVLKSLPQGCPELVMPTYAAVDLKRIRSMINKCVENGVINEEPEGTQWTEFIGREEEKQKVVEDAEQIVYSKENGNYN